MLLGHEKISFLHLPTPLVCDYFDLEALKALDLIVPCWTMGAIPSEYTKNVSIAVGAGVGLAGCHGGMCDSFRRIPSGSSSPAGSGCPTPAETAFTTP